MLKQVQHDGKGAKASAGQLEVGLLAASRTVGSRLEAPVGHTYAPALRRAGWFRTGAVPPHFAIAY